MLDKWLTCRRRGNMLIVCWFRVRIPVGPLGIEQRLYQHWSIKYNYEFKLPKHIADLI